jgi:hypothetical protein
MMKTFKHLAKYMHEQEIHIQKPYQKGTIIKDPLMDGLHALFKAYADGGEEDGGENEE